MRGGRGGRARLQPAAPVAPGHVAGQAPAVPHAGGAQPVPFSSHHQHGPADSRGDDPGWEMVRASAPDRGAGVARPPSIHGDPVLLRVGGGAPGP